MDGFCFEKEERRRKGCGRSTAAEAPVGEKLMMMVVVLKRKGGRRGGRRRRCGA